MDLLTQWGDAFILVLFFQHIDLLHHSDTKLHPNQAALQIVAIFEIATPRKAVTIVRIA